jgi:hypothetical protein
VILAVSGPAFMAVVIVASLLLVWVLLRAEARDEREEATAEQFEQPPADVRGQ